MTPGVALGPGVAVGVASKLRCSASADAKGENPIGGGWVRVVCVCVGGGAQGMDGVDVSRGENPTGEGCGSGASSMALKGEDVVGLGSLSIYGGV